jgi:hypothetical protein
MLLLLSGPVHEGPRSRWFSGALADAAVPRPIQRFCLCGKGWRRLPKEGRVVDVCPCFGKGRFGGIRGGGARFRRLASGSRESLCGTSVGSHQVSRRHWWGRAGSCSRASRCADRGDRPAGAGGLGFEELGGGVLARARERAGEVGGADRDKGDRGRPGGPVRSRGISRWQGAEWGYRTGLRAFCLCGKGSSFAEGRSEVPAWACFGKGPRRGSGGRGGGLVRSRYFSQDVCAITSRRWWWGRAGSCSRASR